MSLLWKSVTKSKNFGVWTTYLAIDSVLGGMLVLGEVVKLTSNVKEPGLP